MKSGEKALIRGRVKQAQSLFKKAQKLKPKKPTPLAQLAWCKLASHKAKAALPLFKQALALSAGHADSLYGLGYAYEKLGNKTLAIKYFNLYLSRYPKGTKVRVINNKLKRLGN